MYNLIIIIIMIISEQFSLLGIAVKYAVTVDDIVITREEGEITQCDKEDYRCMR